MREKEFRYSLPNLKKSQFPDIPLPKGARITCIVERDGKVQLAGNSKGLQYMAKHLAAMSMIKNNQGLHVHLDPDIGQLDQGSNFITVRNLDFDGIDSIDSEH